MPNGIVGWDMNGLILGLFWLLFIQSNAKQLEVDCGVQDWRPDGVLWNGSVAIVGGIPSIDNAWPWQAHLELTENALFNVKTVTCGATIISRRFLLTAAHCVQEAKENYFVTIYAGTHKLNVIVLFPFNSYSVSEVIVHPNYNSTDTTNDIALLKLEKPLTFSKKISPICLENAFSGISKPGTLAYVTGWGYYSGPNDDVVRQDLSKVLLQARVPIVDCNSVYGSSLNTRLCAGALRRGLGSGDSGGPMQAKGSDGKWYQLGIASLSVGKGINSIFKRNCPDIYTRVASYGQFVESCATTHDVSITIRCPTIRVSTAMSKQTLFFLLVGLLVFGSLVIDFFLCTLI